MIVECCFVLVFVDLYLMEKFRMLLRTARFEVWTRRLWFYWLKYRFKVFPECKSMI